MEEKCNPDTCPECGSYRVEFLDSYSDEYNPMKNRMTCLDCGTFYYDIFDWDGSYVDWELI